MPRILNYKSYYEAFKLGVVDDGFTPVARLLFFPLFDPKGSIVLCDENDVPYEANNKNSSAWGNGTEPIPQKIQIEIGKKTNEIGEIYHLLSLMDLDGAFITGDAAFSHADAMRAVVQAGGHYGLSS